MRRKQAIDWYRRFHGRTPGVGRSLSVPTLSGKSVAMMGTLDAVSYTAIVNGRAVPYRHKFKRGSKPMLLTDGKHLYVSGGNFHVTADHGIVDLDPLGHERK